MNIGGDTLDMCKLVAFANREIHYTMTADILDPETYAKEVLKRFQKELSPLAELIVGDLVIGSNEWKEMLTKDYVQCRIDGIWEFRLGTIVVEIGTDSSIDLSEGIAECIFGYVND